MNNQPQKAVPLLESAVNEEPENFKTYLYLGIAYEQLGMYQKAVDIYNQGVAAVKDHKDILYTNAGNNYIHLGKTAEAIKAFSEAITLNSSNTTALRNRAGEYLKGKEYDKALKDYSLYLSLKPDAYQKEEIQRIITLLQGKIDEIAKKKLEEEQKRLAAEKKRKELLNEVLNSLSNASEDTTNMSAGAGKVEQYSDGFDIVE